MVDEIRKDESPVSKDVEREATSEKKEEKPSLGMRLKAIWKKTGLNPVVLLIMAK